MSKPLVYSQDDFHVEHHRSVASAISQIKSYLDKAVSKRNLKKDLPTAVFDIDETMLIYVGEEDADFARTFPRMKDLVKWLRGKGVLIAYITARREWGRKQTQDTMVKLGLFKAGDILMMKPNDFPRNASHLAKAKQRQYLSKQLGRTLVLNMGDQMSDMLPREEWHSFAEKCVALPSHLPLSRSVYRALSDEDHRNISDVLSTALGSLDHCLLFIQLEAHVLISVKMPNKKFFTK